MAVSDARTPTTYSLKQIVNLFWSNLEMELFKNAEHSFVTLAK